MNLKNCLGLGPYILAASGYYEVGLCPIPLLPSSKKPSVLWAQYESNRVSSEQLREWENHGLWGGVALVCGKASSLVVIDYDSAGLYEKLKSLAPLTWIVASGSGRSFHFYARPGEGQTIGTKHIETPWGHLDILGEGSIVVAPPSIHSLTGRPYLFVNKPARIADYTEFSGLIEFLRPYMNSSRRTVTELPTPPADLPPEKLIASIGIVPVKPLFIFDVDLSEGLGVEDLLGFVQAHALTDWDIYETKGGFYIVDREPGMTFDRVQQLLDATKTGPLAKAGYIRNCQRARSSTL